jgi:hypothetical protein
MQFPCHAVLLKGLDCVFPTWFTQCSHVWFIHAMPWPCHSESDFSRPRHSAAWAWHGVCELASAVQRRHMGDLSAFSFSRLLHRIPRTLLSEEWKKLLKIAWNHRILHNGMNDWLIEWMNECVCLCLAGGLILSLKVWLISVTYYLKQSDVWIDLNSVQNSTKCKTKIALWRRLYSEEDYI